MTSPEKTTVPVSVAIPCFGNEASLIEVLRRISACDPLPQEVLLHLDGGWEPEHDPALACAATVRVFRCGKHLGPGGGRDVLLKAARCDVVCSFDDDSWPLDTGYFAQALAVMEAFPNAAVLSPAIYLREKPVMPQLAEASECVAFEGSASVTRQSHYLRLPGYVPVPDAYGVEEVDVSLQARATGFQVLSCPWLRAWHDRPYSDNEHSILPWVRNEVLLAYLRYPRWLQPWGWLRSLRHIKHHAIPNRLRALLQALASTPEHCRTYRAFVRRYSLREIWRHHFAPRKRWTLESEADRLKITEATERGRVMYVQYTNPAGYPPLEHSAMQLASRGWEVRFAGIAGRGAAAMEFPPFPRIQVWKRRWHSPGVLQKLHYLTFTWWCVLKAWRFKPGWVYCSDPLSALPGLWVRHLTGARLIYHEHDSPAAAKGREKWFAAFCRRRRREIASKAQAVVLPNETRLKAFLEENPAQGEAVCVWNCPSINDLEDRGIQRPQGGPLRVLYHGSIVPDRFPVMMMEALAACECDVAIRLIGYEVPGMIGYTDQLKQEARRLGVADRFEYLGTLPQRSDLMARAAECDVGLSLLNYRSEDINMRHMVGASNKPFDYLSQGLALIVPRAPEWEELFVANGCAVACEPGDAQDLARTFRWLSEHRDEVRRMGETGRQLIEQRWNYETQFAKVLALMEQ